jgi:hypothetical protein
MGQGWYLTSRQLYIFYGNRNDNHESGTRFLYIRESYKQLRGWSLLVIGCHT